MWSVTPKNYSRNLVLNNPKAPATSWTLLLFKSFEFIQVQDSRQMWQVSVLANDQ